MSRGVVVGVNDLATTDPHLAEEAYDWDPRNITRGVGKRILWKCRKCQQVFEASPNKRSRGQGCPVCSNHKIVVGINDLGTTDPAIARLADGWDPKQFSRGSTKVVSWKCDSSRYPQHSYTSAIYSKTSGRGCSICSGKKVVVGINDLATTHPDIAREATSDWDPKSYVAGSNKKVNWICSNGHESRKSINQRTQANASGCMKCENLAVDPGVNDLQTLFPKIALEADDWNPSDFVAFSEKAKEWKCSRCGFRWVAVIRSRTGLGSGCGACAGNQLHLGVNDCLTTHPELARQAVDWNPAEYMAGTGKILNYRCPNCGNIYKSSGSNRVQGQGCPKCANNGFDPTAIGWLYLLRNSSKGLLKIGITNSLDSRLRAHRAEGFEKLDISPSMPGERARTFEKLILQMIKTNSGTFLHLPPQEKFSGYTECWLENSFPAATIKELVSRVKIDE